jgi:hypothetical protein
MIVCSHRKSAQHFTDAPVIRHPGIANESLYEPAGQFAPRMAASACTRSLLTTQDWNRRDPDLYWKLFRQSYR